MTHSRDEPPPPYTPKDLIRQHLELRTLQTQDGVTPYLVPGPHASHPPPGIGRQDVSDRDMMDHIRRWALDHLTSRYPALENDLRMAFAQRAFVFSPPQHISDALDHDTALLKALFDPLPDHKHLSQCIGEFTSTVRAIKSQRHLSPATRDFLLDRIRNPVLSEAPSASLVPPQARVKPYTFFERLSSRLAGPRPPQVLCDFDENMCRAEEENARIASLDDLAKHDPELCRIAEAIKRKRVDAAMQRIEKIMEQAVGSATPQQDRPEPGPSRMPAHERRTSSPITTPPPHRDRLDQTLSESRETALRQRISLLRWMLELAISVGVGDGELLRDYDSAQSIAWTPRGPLDDANFSHGPNQPLDQVFTDLIEISIDAFRLWSREGFINELQSAIDVRIDLVQQWVSANLASYPANLPAIVAFWVEAEERFQDLHSEFAVCEEMCERCRAGCLLPLEYPHRHDCMINHRSM